MKVVNIHGIVPQVADSPLFFGGEVTSQRLLELDESKNFTAGNVNFNIGARNKFHTHTEDQILIVTRGKGICATENEEKVVTVGDVIFFPAGEKHWHGATDDSSFSHVTIVGTGSKTTF